RFVADTLTRAGKTTSKLSGKHGKGSTPVLESYDRLDPKKKSLLPTAGYLGLVGGAAVGEDYLVHKGIITAREEVDKRKDRVNFKYPSSPGSSGGRGMHKKAALSPDAKRIIGTNVLKPFLRSSIYAGTIGGLSYAIGR